jgi:hypothetical protein
MKSRACHVHSHLNGPLLPPPPSLTSDLQSRSADGHVCALGIADVKSHVSFASVLFPKENQFSNTAVVDKGRNFTYGPVWVYTSGPHTGSWSYVNMY